MKDDESALRDLLLHHGFLVVGLHHIQLCLLGIQLSLSLLEIRVGYGQTVLLHCQVGLEGKREKVKPGVVVVGSGRMCVGEVSPGFLWLIKSPQGRKRRDEKKMQDRVKARCIGGWKEEKRSGEGGGEDQIVFSPCPYCTQ